MNINPLPAAAVAGTSRAAAKGGDHDKQVSDAAAKQTAAKSPTGKSESAEQLDAGDPTQDRGGDGRQSLDVFESTSEEENVDESDSPSAVPRRSADGTVSDGHVDFDA